MKKPSDSIHPILFVFAALLILTSISPLAGCNTQEETTQVKGQADFDGPVAGGTVTIKDMEGNILASRHNLTDTNGAFSLDVADLPDEFVMEVRGGEVHRITYEEDRGFAIEDPPVHSDEMIPFPYSVERVVSDFSPDMTYSVNILSSICHDIYKELPTYSKKELDETIGELLLLPSYIDVESAIELTTFDTSIFNSEYFLEDMQETWNYDDYEEFCSAIAEDVREYMFHQSSSAADINSATSGTSYYPGRRRILQKIARLRKEIAKSHLVVVKTGEETHQQSRLSTVDFGFNIISFILNAVQKATADTDFGRFLGTAMSYIFEGGPDPTIEAIFKNLEAIYKSVEMVSEQVTDMHKELRVDISKMRVSQKESPVEKAMHNIGEAAKQFQSLSVYAKTAGTTNSTRDKAFTEYINLVCPGKLSENLDQIYFGVTGKNTFSQHGLFDAWLDLAGKLTKNDKSEKLELKIYSTVKKNFERLVLAQCLGTTLLVEALTRKGAPHDIVKRNELIRELHEHLKEETRLFESFVETLTLREASRLYDPKGLPQSTHYPVGSSKKSLLSDVDRYMRKFVFGNMTDMTLANGTVRTTVTAPDLLTIRIVSPYNEGDEAMGVYGPRSARYWDSFASLPGMPNVPNTIPGQSTMGDQFTVKRIRLTSAENPGAPFIDASYGDKEPQIIEGRNPFETRETSPEKQQIWKYNLWTYHKTLDFSKFNKVAGTNSTYSATLETQFDGLVAWHPNLTSGRGTATSNSWTVSLPQINKIPEDTGYSESYGCYGLKAPQPVRLMAYSNDSTHGDVFWYISTKGGNEQDRVYANRQNRYTFFNLWPLGNHVYALRESRGSSFAPGASAFPFTYSGGHTRVSPSNKWVHVNSQKGDGISLYYDLPYINHNSTFLIHPKQAGSSLPKRNTGFIFGNGVPIIQPATKLYTMQTNQITKSGGKFLNWRYMAFEWDRYGADADSTAAQINSHCWISIMPEHEAMVDYLLR